MQMWPARTIANWMIGVALITALVVAPAASAFAACMPMKSGMTTTDAESQPPCDVPCKDCADDGAKKLCQGDCICVKTMIASPSPIVMVAFVTTRLDPEVISAQLALVHPPDTPPPRTLLA